MLSERESHSDSPSRKLGDAVRKGDSFRQPQQEIGRRCPKGETHSDSLSRKLGDAVRKGVTFRQPQQKIGRCCPKGRLIQTAPAGNWETLSKRETHSDSLSRKLGEAVRKGVTFRQPQQEIGRGCPKGRQI